ncbi:MAG TPA: DNA-processing protein DprA [Solirubrobacteraceae bacterium]
MTACDACLRRAGLLAALSGHLEVAWRRRRDGLRDVLALDDNGLAQGLAHVPADEIRAAHPALAPEALRERVAATATRVVCRCDEAYPERLRDLRDAPAALFCAGDPRMLRTHLGTDDDGERLPAVAIVGTRRASPEGASVARGLGRGLAAAGVTVVSGMAMGVDAAAHRGAVDTGGPTVAVLACGPDVAYPASEAVLHRQLRDNALIVAELPPGTTPRRWAFPARNRIIAALAQLTIVVEGAARSGSLITAEFAAGLGREVAAVPGRAGSPYTRGSNGLLKEGAAVVLDAEDALDLVLGTDRIRHTPGCPPADLAPRLRALLVDVRRGHVSVPALAAAGHDVDDALVGLTELELLGLVRRAPGGVVVPVT